MRAEISALRSEIVDSEAPVDLSEEQLDTLAEKVARLASLSPPQGYAYCPFFGRYSVEEAFDPSLCVQQPRLQDYPKG